ncbi:ATP-binding cassette sub- B member 10, mitochondrial [Irineochytrium annulatum]|nr:ATP-binding cassette sub- B member 10, mitochondrial [Irineochytrium annulatum]
MPPRSTSGAATAKPLQRIVRSASGTATAEAVQELKPATSATPAVTAAAAATEPSGKQGAEEDVPLMREAARLMRLARPEAGVLAGAISLLFVSSAVTMSVPFSMGRIIDIVMTSIGVQAGAAAAPFSLSFIFSALCGVFLRAYFVYNMVLRVKDKNRTGELISRLSSDTVIVGKAVTNNISDGLRSSVSALVGLVMMGFVNFKLTLIMMTIVPPVAVAAIYYGRLVRDLSKRTQDVISETTKVAEEKVGNIRTVRSFAQEGTESKRYAGKVMDVYDVSLKEGYATGLFFGGMGFAGNIVVLAILYYGGSMVQSGAISVGDLTSFFLYTAYVGSSFFGLSGFYSELMKGLGASSRLFNLLDQKGQIESFVGGSKLEGLKGRIEFKNVGFAYPTRPDVPIFTDMSFVVEPGTNVAVVGKSGTGKSSIAQLLLRFYDPDSGIVLIDGQDLRTVDPQTLRKDLIAYVSQEPTLFATSIRENIRYGRPEATDEEVIRAADQANARGFIEGFPDGFDTFVGEKGAALSGGQILILDEATSALDAASEYLVQDALTHIVEGRTVITIAHRLSTIQQADLIVMIDGGNVVEVGEYDELVAKEDGSFRELVEAQLTRSE